jgi:cytochrome P450
MLINLGFGYEFNSLETPNDAFAKAYTTLLQQLDISVMFNIAAAYLPFLRKLPFERVLEASAARNLIIQYATSLVKDKEGERRSGTDILSLMIVENENAGGKLEEIELVDQCVTFLFAGHETTSTAVIRVLQRFELTVVGMGFAHSGTTSRSSTTVTVRCSTVEEPHLRTD